MKEQVHTTQNGGTYRLFELNHARKPFAIASKTAVGTWYILEQFTKEAAAVAAWNQLCKR